MAGESEDSTNSIKEKIADWKDALSGALNETQLTFALVVLFVYFTVYISFDSAIDSNRKDVDVVKNLMNHDCDCEVSHKNFYIVWFSICSAAWVLGPFVLWIFQFCNCCPSKINGCCECVLSSLEAIAKKVNKIWKIPKLFKVDEISGPLKQIEKLKWLEYYDLLIKGDDIKKIKFKKIKKVILKAIAQNESSANQDNEAHSESKFYSESEDQCNYNCFKKLFFIHVVCFFLEFARIVAQRATVPLLMLQAFDTYAFLCFTGNEFCTTTAQYDIPLGQAAFTFAFSCSIMISTLTVAMLKWFKYERKWFLCCFRSKVKCSQYKWLQSCI